ncbi:dolichyl pyrophosphate Man9GlcNAc2 alpha-1,3-glucosyltransferase [Colletes gigas]|uniref:dolichyl pyrophosphate Man9GlcNAc2 alpha-1,3-glucosyltransferase n=1 Tax=Colletes gigas TaxID=935657 RepID=UPI001C9A8309|nr:dolichyl pyrophosphate Man9GlcNAc2 alpha-1,3-glucosyltransferase [Colletes gigas]
MKGIMQIILISLFAILLRWCVTYHSYSGQGKPPMFGDYEAQRHWQEITLNLPIDKWYTNTTDNDLQYWGLDYPPLSAYHSLLLGYIANNINSSYVKLHESRGISSEDHKYFMRLTVLCADILVYIPSIIYFMFSSQTSKANEKEISNLFGFNRKHISLLIMLIYPGLILIDHGHFQYNCVSLGLFISTVAAMLQNSYIIGSFLFVVALNYKQMELYHALPIFFYILGKYSPLKKASWLFNLKMLLCISVTVVSTFAIVWLPFFKNLEIFTNVVSRLFPFGRGLFEDKVANVWCTINVFYKIRNAFTNIQLAKICLIATMFEVLPSCINLYLNPQKEKFITSLINCALAFFLFSFQVHEKSILLVAIPVLLYFKTDPFSCFWFLIISHFSMLPLFLKDDLFTPYCATLTFYVCFIFWMCPDVFNNIKLPGNGNSTHDVRVTANQRQTKIKVKSNKKKSFFAKIKRYISCYYKKASNVILSYNLNLWIVVLFYSSILGIIILSIVSRFLKPPNRYPDLFVLLVSVYSCGHFIIFYIYFNYKQFCTPGNIL